MDASSDDELALLEQLENAKRLQAKIEAKLAAKRQRAAQETLHPGDVGASNTTASGDGSSVKAGQADRPIQGNTATSTSTGGPKASTATTTTTPPISSTISTTVAPRDSLVEATPANQLVQGTPASPPKFRTPSPRAMNPFLVSPPSGAMSRKRQHSPSPLPRSTRRPSWTPSAGEHGQTPTAHPGSCSSAGRRGRADGGLSSMISPSRGRSRYGRVVDVASLPAVARNLPAELKAVTQAEAKSKKPIGAVTRTNEAEAAMTTRRAVVRARVVARTVEEGTGGSSDAVATSTETAEDKGYNSDDGAQEEVEEETTEDRDDGLLLDDEDLDAFVDQLEMPLDDENNHAPVVQGKEEVVEKDVDAAQESQKQEKAGAELASGTCLSNDTPGHHAATIVGTDRLTGFRLSSRNLEQNEVDGKLSTYAFFELKDTEGIRQVGQRPSNSGLLSSGSTRAGGRLDLNLSQASGSSHGGATTSTTTSVGGSRQGAPNLEWMLAGVVSAKSKPRTTAKQVRYCHFQISDLRNHEVNVFLFREVMDRHYSQLRVGQVVALLTPKLLSQTDRLGTLGVEVEKTDKLMVIGVGHDIGFCEAVKLNGKDCGKALDRRSGHYCTFHVQLAANRLRSKRGALLASTSSTFDLSQAEQLQRQQQILKGGHGSGGGGAGYFQSKARRNGGNDDQGQSAMQQARRIRNMDDRETNYIFDDGAVGSSSLAEPTTPKKRKHDGEDALTAFLMNQDNPGGMYLRQAMASKDVAWVKDITSPKTPTKGDAVLFPPDMVRRMGYDPVTGRFVPGSPKRRDQDDPEARERSIRMLTERIKSPPSRPVLAVAGETKVKSLGASGSDSQSGGSKDRGRRRLVTGNVFFTEGEASTTTNASTSTSSKATGVEATETKELKERGGGGDTTPVKRWVNLGDDDSGNSGNEEDEQHVPGPDGSPVLSFSAQRQKNLRAARVAMMAAGGGEDAGMVTPLGPRRIRGSPARTTRNAAASTTSTITTTTMTAMVSTTTTAATRATMTVTAKPGSPFQTSSSSSLSVRSAAIAVSSQSPVSPFLTTRTALTATSATTTTNTSTSISSGVAMLSSRGMGQTKGGSSGVTAKSLATTSTAPTASVVSRLASSKGAPKESIIPSQSTHSATTIAPLASANASSSCTRQQQQQQPTLSGTAAKKFVSLSDTDSD